MYLRYVELQNFRNYKKRSLEFSKQLNVILGPNGIGKTNILEAIYVLSQGKSWRSQYDFELIQNKKDFLNIKAKALIKKEDTLLFLAIQKGLGNRSKKAFKINESPKTMKGFIGTLKSVLFSPDDLEIITGSPSKRRRFLDEVLVQTDEEYKKKLSNLKKVVSSRNKILQNIFEGQGKEAELEFWNLNLLKFSNYVTDKRAELVQYLNKYLNENFSSLSNTKSKLKITYKKSPISKERLTKYYAKELGARRTLIGAQKEDLIIEFSKDKDIFVNTRFFASRGEQRTASFMLKLGTLDFIKEKTGQEAILLLDDIYSELDIYHREALSTYFHNSQIIITSSEKDLIPKKILENSKVFKL